MKSDDAVTGPRALEAGRARHHAADLPLVSVIVPAYNEAAILQQNLTSLCRHLESLEDQYRWEVLLINDGSSDETGALAEAFAAIHARVRVLHHSANYGIGRAFQSAFTECHGNYIVSLDLDLSYSPDHIDRLLSRIRETHAQIVVASPYMRGGRVSNVPWLRRILSVSANRFLSLTAKGSLSTLTGMVRAYEGPFVRRLDLSSSGMDVNPEIIYKALLMRGRIAEVPGHLDWKVSTTVGKKRRSSMKLMRHTISVLIAGYLFRPVMFFIVPGVCLLLFSIYVNGWVMAHFFRQFVLVTEATTFLGRSSYAVDAAYSLAPHTFIIGIGSLILAIQLLSLGILALQNQRYFEEMYHLGTSIYGSVRHDPAGAVRRRFMAR